jgi:hypothetical protein
MYMRFKIVFGLAPCPLVSSIRKYCAYIDDFWHLGESNLGGINYSDMSPLYIKIGFSLIIMSYRSASPTV